MKKESYLGRSKRRPGDMPGCFCLSDWRLACGHWQTQWAEASRQRLGWWWATGDKRYVICHL